MKASERRLALILGGLVFLFLLLLSFNYYQKERTRLVQERLVLESTAQEQNIWLRQSDMWLERSRWVRGNQPAVASPRAATADLFSLLEEKARESGVTIENSRLFEPVEVEEQGYVEIGVSLVLDSDLESIIRWAAAVQDPLKFRLFKRFALNTRDDAPTVKVNCTVVQWCTRGTAVESPEPEPAQVDEGEVTEAVEETVESA